MSQQLANHLKSYGRDGDTELVHMTKGEIKGLQELALAHGGSLSINPDTGLVEAGFLKNILPAIAGAGLMMIPGMQGIGAGWIGAGIGALETARTGDIGKGLLAGLGAYGGAGLAGGLTAAAAPTVSGITAGAAPTATTAVAPSALGSTANMAGASNALAGGNSLIAPSAGSFGSIAAPSASSTLGSIAAPTGASTVAPGMAGSQIAKYGMSALAPTLDAALTPKPLETPGEEDLGPNAGKYISKDFRAYEPKRPNPYYIPTGLGYTGYAEGGMIDPMQRMPNGGLAAIQGMRDGYDATQTVDGDIPQMAGGGEIGGYSDGGRMLKGPGDGMSDSIPGVIGNKQPARLADGEFVVPADVVSHLGNGSTDAGAKRLYLMMDSVRKARTGTKKQGKQIKAEKYLPVKKMADGGVTGPAPSSSSVVSPDALMGLADLSALGSMISNTRGPAAGYTPQEYAPAAAQVEAVKAARPIDKPVMFNLSSSQTPTSASLLGGMFSKLGVNREDGANSNSRFGNLSGVSSFTDNEGNTWTRNS
jgi:hypothetical protein